MFYFFVKYMEYDLYRERATEALNEIPSSHHKQFIINGDCSLQIILDFIYEQIGLDEESKLLIDLATTKGALCNIRNYSPTINGTNVFLSKTMYYIVFPQQDESGGPILLLPLLSPVSEEYKEFINLQRRPSSTTKRRSSSNKKTSASNSTHSSVLTKRTTNPT